MTAPKAFPRVAMDLATTVERIQQNFVIADPHLPDCPIVFASDGFLELTEYSREEILGRNCRFLQVGPISLHVCGSAGPCAAAQMLCTQRQTISGPCCTVSQMPSARSVIAAQDQTLVLWCYRGRTRTQMRWQRSATQCAAAVKRLCGC